MKNEFNPTTPEEKFFRELKLRTANAYYTSKVGIHDELGYLGNTYQKEYAGYDVSQEDAATSETSTRHNFETDGA